MIFNVGPHKLSALLGSASEMPNVRPPGRSFDDWMRFLREIADYVAFDGRGDPGILYMAIVERKKWVEESIACGRTYQEAEQTWDAKYERERQNIENMLTQHDRQRVSAMRERDGKGRRQRPPANERLFQREAEAEPDWSDQMQTFATESGLP